MEADDYSKFLSNKISLLEKQDDIQRSLTDRLLIESLRADVQIINLLSKITNIVLSRENPKYISSRVMVITTAGDPKHFPDYEVPYGKSVVIRSHPGNADTMYVGGSELEAKDRAIAFPLDPGEEVEYFIKNMKELWGDADTDGDKFAWTVEKEKMEENG